jgi:hypothetical protein
MDFFEQQEKARRDTRLLLVYLFLAVVWVVVVTYFLVAPFILPVNDRWFGHGERWNLVRNFFGNTIQFLMKPSAVFIQLWNPTLFFDVSAATLAVIGLGTIWKVRQLAAGGTAVAEILEARPLQP